MKITRVTSALIEANFDYNYVCIETADGTKGYGEAFFAPGLQSSIDSLGELLLGEDPRNIRTLTSKMRSATSASSGAFGDGSLLHAISALETALWDLKGKLLGEPVWRLLGGRFRELVPVYADLHAGEGLSSIDSLLRMRTPFWATKDKKTQTGDFYWQNADAKEIDIQAVIKRVNEAAADGYKCVKLDLDVFQSPRSFEDQSLSSKEIEQIAARARQVRESVSPNVEIAYDCHWRFDIPTASRLHLALVDAQPYWLEDPVNPTADGLASVAKVGPIPIASGENAYSLEGVVALARGGGLHVATPDIQKVGGISEGLAIADWTSRQGIGFAPHCIASPLGFVAAVHVMAAARNVSYLEFHGSDLAFWSDIVTAPVISGGYAKVTELPGLGVNLNLDVLREYASPSSRFFGEQL